MISWDRAYLINLDNEMDRQLLSGHELDKWGIEFERFPAIADIIGKEGCRKSHIAIYKKALLENITPLIIEDDIMIQKRFKHAHKYLNALETHCGDTWDIFYFYRDCRRQSIIKEQPLLLHGPTIALHFYMINKRSLSKIIEIAENKSHSIDWNFLYAARECRIKCICASSNLVCQDSTLRSSIVENGFHHTRLGGILRGRK